MPPEERAMRSKGLREQASALRPQDWFAEQRRDLDAIRAGQIS
jgi:hypothetical protein